jgi:glycine cleavage system H protein
MYPESCRYSKDHEWIRVEGDKGTVGISEHAQTQLGDVVFVDLPEVGRSVKAGDVFGTVESVKAVSELYAPVSGEVVEVNSALTAKPETVNKDPYGGGWMIVLKLIDPAEVDGLLDAAAYEALVLSLAK